MVSEELILFRGTEGASTEQASVWAEFGDGKSALFAVLWKDVF